MSDIHQVLFFVLQIAGPIFFMGMQVAALRTSYNIMTTKTVGQLSNIPFLSLMTNSCVWSLYGYLKRDSTVFVPNFSGILAGIACVSIYHTYAQTVEQRYYIVSLSILILSITLGTFGMVDWLGSIGVCMAIFLMGSPLATLATVIKEKNTNALPFYTSLTTFMNALSWFLYGAVEAHDPMIYTPNFIGLMLATVQLCLFVIYGMPKAQTGLPSYTTVPLVRAYEVSPTKNVPLGTIQPKVIQSYTIPPYTQ